MVKRVIICFLISFSGWKPPFVTSDLSFYDADRSFKDSETKLKYNGYYLRKSGSVSNYLIFYQNGWLRSYTSENSISEDSLRLADSTFPFWGLFRVLENDTIAIQTFGGGINGRWDIYERKFLIDEKGELLPTLMYIRKRYEGNVDSLVNIDRTGFKFVDLLNKTKPDSIPTELYKILKKN